MLPGLWPTFTVSSRTLSQTPHETSAQRQLLGRHHAASMPQLWVPRLSLSSLRLSTHHWAMSVFALKIQLMAWLPQSKFTSKLGPQKFQATPRVCGSSSLIPYPGIPSDKLKFESPEILILPTSFSCFQSEDPCPLLHTPNVKSLAKFYFPGLRYIEDASFSF